jgi:hypothetical protein
MTDSYRSVERRRLLALLSAGVATGLAGCGGGTEAASPTQSPTAEPVPGEYETATSISGVERDPDALSAKDAVNYQSEPNEGEQCSGCQYYIEDRNGDGVGACAIVEGTIDPEAWCSSYVAVEDTTATASPTPTPETAEAVAVPSDSSCPVCNMKPAKFPEWNAQVVHEDGQREFFDTSGCMAAYYAVPDALASTDATIAGVWVTDFETGERIEGTTAHFVLETDSDRVDDPMRLNPAPFAERADAEAYVDAVDYLTADDIVGIDAFDRDVAEQYRQSFIDGE